MFATRRALAKPDVLKAVGISLLRHIQCVSIELTLETLLSVNRNGDENGEKEPDREDSKEIEVLKTLLMPHMQC